MKGKYLLILLLWFGCNPKPNENLGNEQNKFEYLKNSKLGKYKKALSFLDKMTLLSGNDTLNYVDILIQLGDTAGAEELFEDYIRNKAYVFKSDIWFVEKAFSISSASGFAKTIRKKNSNYIASRKYLTLSKRLDSIRFSDQSIRKLLMEEYYKNGMSDNFMRINSKMGTIDSINLAFIRNEGLTTDKIDLCSNDNIGLNGVKTVFFVLQHSGTENEKLRLVENCADLQFFDKARLIDRATLHEKGYQIYGTQRNMKFDLDSIQDLKFANAARLKHNRITVDHEQELRKVRKQSK